jgi:hypothetical protein
MREEYEGFDVRPDIISREEIGCEEIDLGLFVSREEGWDQ